MTDNNSPEITDEMIKAALHDEEGNRHTDKEIAQMLFKAVHTATTIAKYTTLLAELVTDAEAEEKPLHPSEIGFATFSSPGMTEPDQSGSMLELAKGLKGFLSELGIYPKIVSSEVERREESTGNFRVIH